MSDPVHILATCRKPELLEMTMCVFKTLRVGFPTAHVTVHLNRIDELPIEVDEVRKVDTIHHQWIESLCATEQSPFWTLDTDVVFWDSMEQWKFDGPLTGRRIPEFQDEFSGCLTRARLHPSLLRIDPMAVREKVEAYKSKIAETPFTPKVNLFYPLCLPFKGRAYFYDTVSLLYHAIGGKSFTEPQLECYDHFNFGTIPDVVLPRLINGALMCKLRESSLNNPATFKGAWRAQEQYYQERQFK